MTLKPRTLKYPETLQAVEQRVVDALPEIIDALIVRAKGGDLRAATYLADRIPDGRPGRRWHRPTIGSDPTMKPPSSSTSKSG